MVFICERDTSDMKERESLAVTAAGFIELMKRLLRDAIPTPPIVLLYAEPPAEILPRPNIEYGVKPEYDPPSSAFTTRAPVSKAAHTSILYSLLPVIIFCYCSKSHQNKIVHNEYGIAGMFCKKVCISSGKYHNTVRF